MEKKKSESSLTHSQTFFNVNFVKFVGFAFYCAAAFAMLYVLPYVCNNRSDLRYIHPLDSFLN